MTLQSPDTPPQVERVLIAGYRAMSPAEKAQRVAALNRALDELATARIKAQHGRDLSARELRLRLGSLHLDARTMRRVFDWDPEVRGF